MKRLLLASALILAAFGPTPVKGQGRLPACDADNGGITLPPGFCALVVSEGAGEGARHIVVAQNGDIFVSRQNIGDRPGDIVALRDTNGDGRADVTEHFGTNGGTGLVLRNGYLYLATMTTVERFKMEPGQLKPSGPAELVVGGMKRQRGHTEKDIVFDERGNMYVNIGLPSNACAELELNALGPDPCPLLEDGGGIWRFKADVAGQMYSRAARYATGMRQPLALAWLNGKLYVAMNSRDSLNTFYPSKFTDEENAVRPLEPLLEVNEGDVFGWPYCFFDGKLNTMILGPEYGGDGKTIGRCGQYKAPAATFPAHWAPVDLMPYTATQFPEHYRGGLFMSAHGSHNRTPLPQDGYNVTFQPFANGKVSGKYEVFADGFRGSAPVMNRTQAVARPDGTAQGPDGSLYIVESVKGKIWRVIYRGGASSAQAAPAPPAPPRTPPLLMTTTAFEDGGVVPNKYTLAATGPQVSPELTWSQVPPGTKSFVLLVRDANPFVDKSPKMDGTHWVVWNIPAASTGLPEGMPAGELPNGTRQVGHEVNAYTGPGAGPGPYHHYMYELYALDTVLTVPQPKPALPVATRVAVFNEMDGHVLGKAVIMGRFHR